MWYIYIWIYHVYLYIVLIYIYMHFGPLFCFNLYPWLFRKIASALWSNCGGSSPPESRCSMFWDIPGWIFWSIFVGENHRKWLLDLKICEENTALGVSRMPKFWWIFFLCFSKHPAKTYILLFTCCFFCKFDAKNHSVEQPMSCIPRVSKL